MLSYSSTLFIFLYFSLFFFIFLSLFLSFSPSHLSPKITQLSFILEGDCMSKLKGVQFSQKVEEFSFIGDLSYVLGLPSLSDVTAGQRGVKLLSVPFQFLFLHSRRKPTFASRLYQSLYYNMWRRTWGHFVYAMNEMEMKGNSKFDNLLKSRESSTVSLGEGCW
jgi:hypothetical protein